jgi:mitochondrial import inner membrane translocase subunit TIM16
MASRVLAQFLLMGGTYVARAFVTAYQQALINSARQGGAAAGGAARAGRAAGMRVEEASEVLGVPRDAGLKEIYGRYDRLFHANAPEKGGSIYIQAKIHNAKDVLERGALERGEVPPPPAAPPADAVHDAQSPPPR